jgi:hypothetical protein
MIHTDDDRPVINSLSSSACMSVHTEQLVSVVLLLIFHFLRFLGVSPRVGNRLKTLQ